MGRREANLLWLKDLLEHLTSCQQQLEWVEDPETVRFVTEAMLRDLDHCRELCRALQQRALVRQAS